MSGRPLHNWAILDAQLAELIRSGEVTNSAEGAARLGLKLSTFRAHLRDAYGIRKTVEMGEFVERFEARTEASEAPPGGGELEPDEVRIQHLANGSLIIETLLAITEEEAKSPRRVLELLKFDPALWRVVQVDIGLWTGQRSHKLGGGQEPLQAVKAKIAPIVVAGVPLEDILANIATRFEAGIPAAPKLAKRKKASGGLIAEFPQVDHHLGNDPAQGEYNAEQAIAAGQAEILARLTQCEPLERIVLPVMGDIFHYDTRQRTTTGGTPMGSSLGPHEMIDLGLILMTRLVADCAALAPVEVIFVPGNHDYLLGYTLLVALQAHFRHDSKHISFDLDKQSRKWRRWGVNIVGWEHGELPKGRAMNWLAVEAASDWSQALYKEIHSGHYHSRRMNEEGGVIHQNLPSPAPTDTWHYERGFVGASRGFMAFVWAPDRPGWREQWFAEVNAM